MSAPLRSLMLLGTCAALAACGPGENTEVQSLDGDLVRQAVTTVGNWSGFGTGQCVSGVYTFYENRFGISLNGCCAQAGNVGSCEHCGACMIWESGAVEPPSSLFNRYDWGTTMPQTYDIVVYPPYAGTVGYGHVACVDHTESGDPAAWQSLYVMDSNYLVANQTASHVHTVNRAPYGIYRLKSLDVPDGYYCGGHRVAGDASTLYRVQGGATSAYEVCPGWCAPSDSGDFCARLHHGRTAADLNGDGKADLCGRAAAEFACWPATAGAPGFDGLAAGPELSDAHGWGDPTYYSSIQMADVNGDGRADVCARAADGIHCWLGDGSGAFPTEIAGPALSDASGWADPSNARTLRFADVNGDGKADLCARANAGVLCWLSDGHGFPTEITGPALSDAHGWDSATYYASLQFADVNGDGKADLCARSSAGFSCWLSDGAGFPTEVTGPTLSNANGFASPAYGSTLQMADVNGDGKADVCVRTASEFTCWLSDGAGFPTAVHGPPLSDAAGWSAPVYFQSIQMADVNGDGKADVCARGAAGIFCWLSDGTAFPTEVQGPALSDAAGWSDPTNSTTLDFADLDGDGRADVCARANALYACWLSNGAGFDTQVNGPAISDAASWGMARYVTTVQMVGGIGPAVSITGGSSGAGSTGSSGSGGTVGSAGTTTGGVVSSTGSAAGSASSSGSGGSGASTGGSAGSTSGGDTVPVGPVTAGCGAASGGPGLALPALVLAWALRRRRAA